MSHLQEYEKFAVQIVRVPERSASAVTLADRFQVMLVQRFVKSGQQIADLTGGRHTEAEHRAIAEVDHSFCGSGCGVFDCTVGRLASHSIQKRCGDRYKTELTVKRFVVCHANRPDRQAKIVVAEIMIEAA